MAAPVFHRVAQQVLEYLHVPHDTEIPANRQLLLARTKTDDTDLDEGSPDHPGEAIETAEATEPGSFSTAASGAPGVSARVDERDARLSTIVNGVVPAAMREKTLTSNQADTPPVAAATSSSTVPQPQNGTAVLDVEQGGIVVPSFTGKSVRSAIELAQTSGLDLAVVGSGVGQDQSPAPGSRVPSGARITVRFGR